MSSSGANDLENSRIPLEEIIRATNNFSIETKRGEGGFGVVYKGQLSESWNNRLVAIKRLHPNSFQGNKEFNNELKMYSIFNHPNIIPFIGYYNDANEKILVYEYASKGSLDHHLQDQNKRRYLTWEQRLKICLGAAKGIKYLHSGVGEYTRVIHRDLKSANILLDDNLEAKICDFGLSRFTPRNLTDTRVRTKAAGTMFYMDPVYHERRVLSKESDIYSFGVVMFEMSSGMMAYNPRRFGDAVREKYLIDLVRSHYDDHELVGGINELIDTATQIETSSFHKFNEIAHECINLNLNKRPTIDKIIQRIEEALNILFNLQVDPQRNLHQRGRTTYMLGGKDLSIAWQNDTRYWELEHKPNSRFPEVWILKAVYWLEIQGRIAAVMLSPNITYVTYLVFRTAEDTEGLSLPAETKVSYGGKKRRTHNVYLQRPLRVQEDYVVPRHREDGWMEVKLGEFKCDEGDDGEVKIKLKEVNTENRKTGLTVAGIEIRSI